jgi:hypothetical protein
MGNGTDAMVAINCGRQKGRIINGAWVSPKFSVVTDFVVKTLVTWFNLGPRSRLGDY